MKKTMVTAVSVLMAIAMIFCFAACGGNDGGSGNNNDEANITKYIADNNLEATLADLGQGIMDVKVSAKGSSLVLDMNISIDLTDEQLSSIEGSAAELLDGMESSAQEMITELKDKVGVAAPSVVININKKDGSNIATKTFK